MANEQNLIMFGAGKRTEKEEREMQSRGGKKSGETRRRKAALRDTMNKLLTMQVEIEGLSDILRADDSESTYETVISMAMIQKAMMGDVKAFNAIKDTIGQTSTPEEDGQNENIQNFLKAMRPTEEDLGELFEGDDDGEEETTGEV